MSVTVVFKMLRPALGPKIGPLGEDIGFEVPSVANKNARSDSFFNRGAAILSNT